MSIVKELDDIINKIGGISTGNGGTISQKLDQLEKALGNGGASNVTIVGIYNPAPDTFICTHTLEEMVELVNDGQFLVLKNYSPDGNENKTFYKLAKVDYNPTTSEYSLTFTYTDMSIYNGTTYCSIFMMQVQPGETEDTWSSDQAFVQLVQA